MSTAPRGDRLALLEWYMATHNYSFTRPADPSVKFNIEPDLVGESRRPCGVSELLAKSSHLHKRVETTRPPTRRSGASHVRHPILGRRGDRHDTSAERIIGAGVAVGMDGHEIDRHTAR